jgi:GTP-binding protein LepA
MNNTRNFSIIAHIDHGKSTLADRLLEKTKTVALREMQEQYLDSNPISRERGITIKLATVHMEYELNNVPYILNLIDTPGHVDFSYEVSRSLAACEGAILLIDATQGIQAQTMAHLLRAREQGIVIIPVINKIDLPNVDIEKTKQEIISIIKVKPEEILSISAKTGQNVDLLIEEVIKRIPPPQNETEKPLKALVFNSEYESHRGVIIYVRVFEGKLSTKDTSHIHFINANEETTVEEIGVFSPKMVRTNSLTAGDVGYIVTGLRKIQSIKVGDTVTKKGEIVTPIPGYKEQKPVVFLGLYPTDADINRLKDALEKLQLNDPSLIYEMETSKALGHGVRCGFQGLLHADVTQERLEREFNLNLIATSPTVEYHVKENGKIINMRSVPEDWTKVEQGEIEEPWVLVKIFTPEKYLGQIMSICTTRRSTLLETNYFDVGLGLVYEMPLGELISGFYDQLKSVSQGYASLEYEEIEYRPAKLVKLSIIINHEPIDALSLILPPDKAHYEGQKLLLRLKEIIPRQMFSIPLQAAIGGKILAREDIQAFRKDVTQKLYGGDRTRKDKLLEAQKKGKKRLMRFGKIEIPQEAFFAALKTS